MKKRFWVTALAVVTTFTSTLSMADPWWGYHDGPPPRYYAPPPPPREHWGPPPPSGYWEGHPYWGHPQPHYYPVRYWHEGQALPPEYCDHQYDVDWRDNGLPPPPHGHHWMRINGDYVLVAAASSLITAILLGSH